MEISHYFETIQLHVTLTKIPILSPSPQVLMIRLHVYKLILEITTKTVFDPRRHDARIKIVR